MAIHSRYDWRRKQAQRTKLKKVVSWGLVLEIALILGLQPYRPVMVVGGSMLPTLGNLQLVIAMPIGGGPRRGDIVVCDLWHDTIIKRVAGLEHDGGLPGMGEWMRVPRNHVYLLGDNPRASLDSRLFGPVPTEDVRMLVVYPANERGRS